MFGRVKVFVELIEKIGKIRTLRKLGSAVLNLFGPLQYRYRILREISVPNGPTSARKNLSGQVFGRKRKLS